MASAILKRLYREARARGETARNAWREAIIRRKWESLESAGFVRFDSPPDDDPDLSFLDQDCYQSDRGAIACAKRIRETASNEGCFGLVGQYRLDVDSEDWNHGDSVWGFIGYDDVDTDTNPYAVDIMNETIRAFRDTWKDHIANRCPMCHGSGRVK